jgi:hypothetical protein
MIIISSCLNRKKLLDELEFKTFLFLITFFSYNVVSTKMIIMVIIVVVAAYHVTKKRSI